MNDKELENRLATYRNREQKPTATYNNIELEDLERWARGRLERDTLTPEMRFHAQDVLMLIATIRQRDNYRMPAAVQKQVQP